jgi:Rieske Fe-S protein
MPDSTTPRRALLRGAAVSVAAGIAGYAVARSSSLTQPRSPTTGANGYGPSTGGGRFLADLQQIPAEGSGLILSKALVVLVREPGGSIRGFSAVCTHQGCTVSSVQNGVIMCPCHGSQFNARTGAVVGGPAPRPLPAVPITVRSGAVYTA